MRYLDANVFIYPVIDNDNRADFYKKIIYDVVSGKIQACTSVLTWDEVIHYLIKEKGKSFALTQSEKFLKLPNLYLIDASSSIIFTAHQLMKKYDINPRDAIHLATALSSKSDEIISEDKVFNKIKEIKRRGFR
jgi:uncharacterized protein